MRRLVGRIVVLAVGLCVVRHVDAQDVPATPAEQYQKLLEACEVESPGRVLSDEERIQFVGHAYRVRNEVALRFVALAEKYPTDPIAREVLTQAVWQVNTTPWPVELVGKNDAVARALALLQRDHVESKELGPLCQRLSWGFCKEYETFLRAVAKSNPQPAVKAVAVLSLAHFLNHRSQRIELLKEQPEAARQFKELFGHDYIDELMRQDGVSFKLSGERGKVVLLDFWSQV